MSRHSPRIHGENATLRRSRGSSILPAFLTVCTLLVIPVTGTAQTPVSTRDSTRDSTRARLDSLARRLEDAESAIQLLRDQLATEASSGVRTRSRLALEFSGRVLMNAYGNTARTNNVDVPVFARPDSGTGPQGGVAMGIRQTTLGLAVTASDVAGGSFLGDVDVDFFGGQLPSSGGRTFPLVRLRTARATLSWSKGSVMIGQEQPLITGLDPVSLAAVGVPGFTAAGNLWLWLPQVRAGVHSSGRLRVGLEGAVLAPTSGDPNGLFDTQFDAAERTSSPYLQGLLRLSWGDSEREGSVTFGVHSGRIANALDVAKTSEAVAATLRIPVGTRLELRGEAYQGAGLRGLGGGGIAQGIGAGGEPVRTRAGWGQLNVQFSPRVLWGVGAGFDDPRDAHIAAGGRVYNRVTETHLHLRPVGPMLLGLEWRQIATEFTVGSRSNQHINLALGFEF